MSRTLVSIVTLFVAGLGATHALAETKWVDASTLRVEGKGWSDTETFWNRLPAKAKGVVPKAVWTLQKNTAGICVRFVTDSKTIRARWDGGDAMNHMAATGNSGLDLYVKEDDKWVYCGTGRPQRQLTTATVTKNRPGTKQEYLLYLPLYHDVTLLHLAVDDGAILKPAPPRPAKTAKPIVMYGTSILQGGCASRAGMCHAAILGRWLDRELINLGFSGSGKTEPELADLLCELDPVMYVLEPLPNMNAGMVRERMEPCIRKLRKAHPDTPILLLGNPVVSTDHEINTDLVAIYVKLKKEEFSGLYYLSGEGLFEMPGEGLPGQFENGTVDGVHPTDLGFYRMAQAYYPVMKEILDTTSR